MFHLVVEHYTQVYQVSLNEDRKESQIAMDLIIEVYRTIILDRQVTPIRTHLGGSQTVVMGRDMSKELMALRLVFQE